jgi:hypothetical protein
VSRPESFRTRRTDKESRIRRHSPTHARTVAKLLVLARKMTTFDNIRGIVYARVLLSKLIGR